MKQFYISILAILAAFPLAALGHDLYLWYDKYEDFMEYDKIVWSDIGYLFVNYAPDFYDDMQDMIGAEMWNSYMIPIMEANAIIFSAVLPGLMLVYLGIAKVFWLWPYEQEFVRFTVKDAKKKRK